MSLARAGWSSLDEPMSYGMVCTNYEYALQSVSELDSSNSHNWNSERLIYSWSTIAKFLFLSLSLSATVFRDQLTPFTSRNLPAFCRYTLAGHRRRPIFATDRADKNFDTEAEKPRSSKKLRLTGREEQPSSNNHSSDGLVPHR